jgi:archaellum component FlaC
MTQDPGTITDTWEEVLGKILQKLDRVDNTVERLQKEVAELNLKILTLETEWQL